MKQVFVSYVFEDKGFRTQLERWAADGKLGAVQISGEHQDLRQKGEAAIRNHLVPLLAGAAALIVLVGDNSHNHEWVSYETDVMQSARKPVLVVRLPGTRGAPPPSIRHLAELAFEADALRRAIGS